MAYFTRPVGFRCRSKYLTVLCCIWSCNSVLAYCLHRRGERNVSNNGTVNGYFCISGTIIAMLLIFLSILSNTRILWVKIFGDACADSSLCPEATF